MWPENWHAKLSEHRQAIDSVDSEILELLAKRMKISEEVGEIKSKLGLPICVPEREAVVVNDRQNLGRIHGLRDRFIRVLFKLIMFESKKVQKKLASMYGNLDEKYY